jgi:hypothetical protein
MRWNGAGLGGRNGDRELVISPTGSGRPCLRRSAGLVDQQRFLETETGKTPERG